MAELRRTRFHNFLNRGVGLILLAVSLVIAAGLMLAPIPAFDELAPHSGTLLETRRQRFSPCYRGDCTRTMVTVRHDDGVRKYHFGDVDPADMEEVLLSLLGHTPSFVVLTGNAPDTPSRTVGSAFAGVSLVLGLWVFYSVV